ncbi:MAG: hypothetical protein ABS79_01155 [Planctomycetes bacterium SCN 63-9]|nr:MAG: hypothetical protein ABS79_01155 [Planctomycetes bacterium SCN 63-9]
MPNLLKGSHELFRRSPDESFSSLGEILARCRDDAEGSTDRWKPPKGMKPVAEEGKLRLDLGDGNVPFSMNDWSFTQLCGLAGVGKDTLNRLSAETAGRVFSETLPGGNKPAQLFTRDNGIRSIHGHSYSRLHDSDLVSMLMEFAVDFTPPQPGCTGGTGLYRGEQDLFCFMIDPTGWVEVEGEAFAPGFFAWNSEVGRRSVGVQSFWFQAVCANHIVWDAVDITEFTRKHTGKVSDALPEMRRMIEALVAKRDDRKDRFSATIRSAMKTRVGDDIEEALKLLSTHGIRGLLAKRALDLAANQGRFTIFSVVDALTRIAGEIANAGDRAEMDQKASRLLTMVSLPTPPWIELNVQNGEE